MTEDRGAPRTNEDVAEIVDLAARLQRAEREAVDVREIGAELGIEERHVVTAQAEVARRRERRSIGNLRLILMLVLALFVVAGAVSAYLDARPAPEVARPLEGVIVAFDTGRGEVVKHAGVVLESRGGAIRDLAATLSDEALREVSVLALSHARRAPFSAEELRAMAAFVERGGGLLVADLGWSWVHDEKKRLEALPANEVGKRLGFSFTDEVLDGVMPLEVDAGGPLGSVRTWIPGGITVAGPDARVILRDARHRPIAGVTTFGRGRVVVFGHPGILDDHSHVLAWALAFAAGKVEAHPPRR